MVALESDLNLNTTSTPLFAALDNLLLEFQFPNLWNEDNNNFFLELW